MNKKFLAVASAAVIAFSTLLSGCGSNGADNKLTMATNAEFPPYEYMEDGKVVGIDAEIAQAIADKLGMELEINNINFDAIIPAVHQ